MAKEGRPSKYQPEFVDKVDEYLKLRQDQEVDVQSTDKQGKDIYSEKIKVKLPTIEGFAAFIGVNKTTLYEWAKIHKEFSNALEKILTEQHARLIDNGLSGDYNPTIAKLILSSNHGMAEKSEQKHTGNLSLTSILSKVDEAEKEE